MAGTLFLLPLGFPNAPGPGSLSSRGLKQTGRNPLGYHLSHCLGRKEGMNENNPRRCQECSKEPLKKHKPQGKQRGSGQQTKPGSRTHNGSHMARTHRHCPLPGPEPKPETELGGRPCPPIPRRHTPALGCLPKPLELLLPINSFSGFLHG